MKPKSETVKSLLDDVFHRPEKEVKRFVGVLSAGAEEDVIPGAKPAMREKIQSGIPDKVQPFAPATQVSGGIVMQHGWDGEDYVWHIEPGQRRHWVSSVERAMYATAKAMHDVIPDHIYVKVFRPVTSWEVKVFTFKALRLKRCWNVQPGDITRLNAKLFVILNALI